MYPLDIFQYDDGFDSQQYVFFISLLVYNNILWTCHEDTQFF